MNRGGKIISQICGPVTKAKMPDIGYRGEILLKKFRKNLNLKWRCLYSLKFNEIRTNAVINMVNELQFNNYTRPDLIAKLWNYLVLS